MANHPGRRRLNELLNQSIGRSGRVPPATEDWHGFATWRTYRCNWRIVRDNLCYDMHTPLVPRNSPELMFQPVFPFASELAPFPLSDDSGIGYVSTHGVPSGDYPGLGPFPPKNETRYRFLKPTARGGEIKSGDQAVVKCGVQLSLMPGATFIGRQVRRPFRAALGHADRCRQQFLLQEPIPPAGLVAHAEAAPLLDLLYEWLLFDQEQLLLEKVIPGKEIHSRSDAGMIVWRRYATGHAGPRAEAGAREPAPRSQPRAAE